MPKQMVRDVFGELLETGKKTAKTGGQAATGVASQAVKSLLGQRSAKGSDTGVAGLDKLEQGQAVKPRPTGTAKTRLDSDKAREEQIKKMSQLDKQRSQQAYKDIQKQIDLIRKKKASLPRKYERAKPKFDEEQVKDPESFWDKITKKKEKAEKTKRELPLSAKKGRGTGEIRRGVSG